MLTDAELLQRYVSNRAEAAFGELVNRHVNLVYAAALRRTNGRHALAEEVTQKVFTDLARKAPQLTRHPTIVGWLHCSTRFAAIDALRTERRGQKLAQSVSAMLEDNPTLDTPAEWEQVRPAIDAALDRLKEQDREIVLLRFFKGLSFAEVGSRLNLNEGAARMRTERALEKLRRHLATRGVTSTAALAALLANQSVVAAPANLAASIAATALAAPPASVAAIFLANFLMNKIVAISLSAAFAAVSTTFVWTAVAEPTREADLAALRAENDRLARAAAPGAAAASVAAVADKWADQTTAVVQEIGQRLHDRNSTGNGGHRDHGQATPRDSVLSLGWAADAGDIAALVRILSYDATGKEAIREIYADLPESVRHQYPTAEEFNAFCYAGFMLLHPVPGGEVWEKKVAATVVTQLNPGRVRLRQPGQVQGGIDVVQTDAGWKVELRGDQIRESANRFLSAETLAKLGQSRP